MRLLERDHTADFNPIKPYLSIVGGIKVFAVDADVFLAPTLDIEFKLTYLSLLGYSQRSINVFVLPLKTLRSSDKITCHSRRSISLNLWIYLTHPFGKNPIESICKGKALKNKTL